MKQVQRQLLYKAIKEPDFARDILRRIPLKEFDEDKEAKNITQWINSYYRLHQEPLDKNTLGQLTEHNLEASNMGLDKRYRYYEIVEDLFILDEEMQNDEVIDDYVEKYVRQVLSKDVISKAILNGNLEDEETITKLSEDLLKITTLNTKGKDSTLIRFFKDYDLVKDYLAKMDDKRVPTGLRAIDSVADGGLATGELALVIAKSGGGKTMVATNLTNLLIRQGFNVLYFSLEEKMDRMLTRFIQVIGQQTKSAIIPDGKLNTDYLDIVHQAFDSAIEEHNWGDLYVSKHMPGVLTPFDMEQVISNIMIRDGVRIDAVVVDYPDLMKNPHLSGSENESRSGGRLFEDLRRIAQTYDVVVWTLSQVNRTGYSQEVLTSEAIEGSKQKVNACELVVAVNQTPAEFEAGFIRFYLDKVRNNSGSAFDRMRYLKVIPSTMTIRDETEEETDMHMAVVNERTADRNQDHNKKNKVDIDDTNEGINNINDSFNVGGF